MKSTRVITRPITKRGSIALVALCAPGVLLVTGCLSSPDSRFAFPPDFTAQQTVHVKRNGRTETFVALLERSERALGVTLMDPLFQMPLVAVTKDAAGTRARWFIPEPAQSKAAGARMPERLMDLLGDLYANAQWNAGAAQGEKTSRFVGFSATISRIPQTGSCRFPALIVVAPQVGPASEVRVETSDVQFIAAKDAP